VSCPFFLAASFYRTRTGLSSLRYRPTADPLPNYQNRRPDYIKTFLEHLVNWDFANQNLAKA